MWAPRFRQGRMEAHPNYLTACLRSPTHSQPRAFNGQNAWRVCLRGTQPWDSAWAALACSLRTPSRSFSGSHPHGHCPAPAGKQLTPDWIWPNQPVRRGQRRHGGHCMSSLCQRSIRCDVYVSTRIPPISRGTFTFSALFAKSIALLTLLALSLVEKGRRLRS